MPRGVYERQLVPPEVRFWRKVEKTPTCWIWRAAFNGKYGAFGISKGEVRLAHRYAYTLANGPIPEKMTIDHLCRNTACVNPAHLEAVSLRENILRGEHPSIVAYRAGTCERGHARTSENTYVYPDGRQLACSACRRERLGQRKRVPVTSP